MARSFNSSLQETPVKKRSLSFHVHSHPINFEPNKENHGSETAIKHNDDPTVGIGKPTEQKDITHSAHLPEQSIYKTLGWDDADDLDELM